MNFVFLNRYTISDAVAYTCSVCFMVVVVHIRFLTLPSRPHMLGRYFATSDDATASIFFSLLTHCSITLLPRAAKDQKKKTNQSQSTF